MSDLRHSNISLINLLIMSIVPFLIWGPFFPDLIISIFTLFFLSLKGLGWVLSNEIHLFILEYELIYYLTAIAVVFTLYTGFSYALDNQKAIKEIMN